MLTETLYELRVLTGLHRGSALPLVGSQWMIGSASHADLELYDPGIKDQHCVLTRTDNLWTLERRDGDLKDAEGHSIECIPALEPETPFALNGIWLAVTNAAHPWPEDDLAAPTQPTIVAQPPHLDNAERSKAQPRPRHRMSVLLLLGVLLPTIAMWGGLYQAPEQPAHQTVPEFTVLPDRAAVRLVVEAMLKERELEKRVRIQDTENALELVGRFAEEDLLPPTSALVRKFNKLYRSPVQVRIGLSETPPQLPFTLVQISNGRLPHILTSTGQRLFIGDELDGLRLIDINRRAVVFQGHERIEIPW